jgi:peptidyl-tRNA hydrolase
MDIPRIRFGIGQVEQPRGSELVDFVLQRFSKAEVHILRTI